MFKFEVTYEDWDPGMCSTTILDKNEDVLAHLLNNVFDQINESEAWELIDGEKWDDSESHIAEELPKIKAILEAYNNEDINKLTDSVNAYYDKQNGEWFTVNIFQDEVSENSENIKQAKEYADKIEAGIKSLSKIIANEKCPDCKGSGRDNVPYGEKCSNCDGEGSCR